jgi:hypothetical protein
MYVLVILVTIFQLKGSPTMSEPKCDFVKIARDVIATKFPHTDFSYYSHPVISESGSFVEVRYDFPPDLLVFGFVPVVVIHKRSCKVVHADMA